VLKRIGIRFLKSKGDFLNSAGLKGGVKSLLQYASCWRKTIISKSFSKVDWGLKVMMSRMVEEMRAMMY